MKAPRIKCKLGKFVNLKRGYDLPNQERTAGQYPIVSSSGITDYHKDFMVEGPGVVTGRYGTLGKVFYIPGRYWPLNTSLYVQDFKGNDPKFIYYYLGVVLSANFNSAGAVPGVNRNVLHKLAVPEPPKSQKKIASILSAYDDLIENNKRRIAILEKMAEEIYREWFVRMRFNGYQKTKFSKGIPAGWKAGRLSDLLDDACIQTGKRPKGGAQESGIPSIGAENVVGLAKYNFDKEKYVGEDFFNAMRHGHIEDRDVLFYKDGAEIGRVTLFQDHFPHAKCCVNEHVFILRTEEKLWQYFLYFYLNQEAVKAYVKLINKNAAQPGINKKELKSLPLVLPKPEVIDSFNQVIAPIVQAIFALAKTEVNLKKTRDLLLPRLISGKLSVEHIELPSNENASPISSALPQAELAHA